MTFLEQVGRAAVVQVEDAGALTMQFWSVLRKLPRVLPVVGARRRWRSAVVADVRDRSERASHVGARCRCAPVSYWLSRAPPNCEGSALWSLS